MSWGNQGWDSQRNRGNLGSQQTSNWGNQTPQQTNNWGNQTPQQTSNWGNQTPPQINNWGIQTPQQTSNWGNQTPQQSSNWGIQPQQNQPNSGNFLMGLGLIQQIKGQQIRGQQFRGQQNRNYGESAYRKGSYQQSLGNQGEYEVSEYNYGKDKGWFRDVVKHEKTTFSPHPNQQYKIMSGLGKNMCLDLSAQENKLNLWEYKNGLNQKYNLRIDNNRIIMISCANGGAIEVKGSIMGDGVDFVAAQPSNSPNQKFHFVPVKGGMKNQYHIRTFCNRALDVSGENAINGAAVFQYAFHGGKNQIWSIQPA